MSDYFSISSQGDLLACWIISSSFTIFGTGVVMMVPTVLNSANTEKLSSNYYKLSSISQMHDGKTDECEVFVIGQA